MSAFRDGLLALTKEPQAFKDIETRFGLVRVQAPLGSRVQEFVKALGDKAADLLQSQGGLIAMSCFDPVTGEPHFGPSDIESLNKLPAGSFGTLNKAVGEVGESLSLDPTTPATPPGSDCRG